MKFKTEEDIIRFVSSKTNKDPKLIKYVINDLWSNVRHLLTNPVKIPFNLLLNKFCKFEITDFSLKTKLENTNKPHIIKILKEIKEIRDGKKKK